MSSVGSAPARNDIVTHWKWTIAFCAAAALFWCMWPQYDDASYYCVTCASRRTSSRVSSMFGVFRWTDESRIEDSILVTDGLVASGHQHVWETLTATSKHFGGHSIACGLPRVRPFAWWYAYDTDFRREVSDGMSAGTLTREQVERALNRAASDSTYRVRPVIADLIEPAGTK